MNRDDLLRMYRFDPQKGLKTGFIQKNDVFTYSCPMSGDFVFSLELGVHIDVHVLEDGEVYALFDVEDATGSVVSAVRAEADRILGELLEACFEKTSYRKEVADYCLGKYGTEPEYLFDDYKEYFVLRAENGKWYAIVMSVPPEKLGLPKGREVDVMNLKLPPEKITALVDGERYFSAYHMNKKYWMSVLLDRREDFEQIKSLLDESHALVTSKKKAVK